ncbi:hypothetical protein ACWGDS_25895 [Streptomyces sp. NPDC055059]
MTTTLLAAALALAAGWCIGHRTVRVIHAPIGGTAAQDDAAFIAEQRTRFEQLVADLDLPTDRRP